MISDASHKFMHELQDEPPSALDYGQREKGNTGKKDGNRNRGQPVYEGPKRRAKGSTGEEAKGLKL